MRQYVELTKYADEFPYNCPCCGQHVRQRRRGMCPACDSPIETFSFGRGKTRHRMWVQRRGRATEIVDHIESKIREVRMDPKFCFTDRKLQIGLATTFLRKCAGEADIAHHIVEAYFNRSIASAYKLWPSCRDIQGVGSIIMKGGTFDNALSYARSKACVERAGPIEQVSSFATEQAHAWAE